jgi:ribosome-associated translation inhibitor RaiA
MQTELQVATRNIKLTAASRSLIARYARKLELFHSRITRCRVMVEVRERFPAGPPVRYHVRIDATVPGAALAVTRRSSPELETAIQRAFATAGRRLQDVARRHRGDVNLHPPPND